MTDPSLTGRLQRRRRRHKATPWAATIAVTVGSVGALAWVAPRTSSPTSGSSVTPGKTEAAYLASEAAALQKLEKTLAAQQKAVAALGSQPGFNVTKGATIAIPALPSIPIAPPPAVHATTGASRV